LCGLAEVPAQHLTTKLEETRMKKLVLILLVVLMLAIVFPYTAFAAGNQPGGGCPTGFTLMNYMDPAGDPMNMTHIGGKLDMNGDGFICMKMLTPDFCLHVDNSIPLP
jgi:hypothetical protein